MADDIVTRLRYLKYDDAEALLLEAAALIEDLQDAGDELINAMRSGSDFRWDSAIDRWEDLRGNTHRLEHSTEILRGVHDQSKCLGQYCTIHNRSDHSMRAFPQHWRDDRGLMERICPHGVGHPDPDSPYSPGSAEWIHGCDGCCAEARRG